MTNYGNDFDYDGDAEDTEKVKEISVDSSLSPIERLKPKSKHHEFVLGKLTDFLDMSEKKMRQFHSRWGVAEKKLQAYIELSTTDQVMQDDNDAGKPPKIVSIVVPYTYSTVATIVTYLMHTFTGRKPIFQVSSYKQESIEAAKNMETVLQFQADHTRLIKQFYQWFTDGEVYGLGILKTSWIRDVRKKTQWVEDQEDSVMAQLTGDVNNEGQFATPSKKVKKRLDKVVYEGNVIEALDPYMFLPDPRVPMAEVNKKGEFVFWRSFENKYELKKKELAEVYSWIKYVGKMSSETNGGADSYRADKALGDAFPARTNSMSETKSVGENVQIDQGTVEIIPSDWGLSESEVPEKWLFTVANKTQIIQAEPYECDHDMHPVAVIEPYSVGYSFGQLGLVDMLAGIQDSLSWFMNSHIYNVRASLNNMFIVDPSKIEMQDLKNPKPGKIIRIKRSGVGLDVRSFFQQLPVTDVTKGHVKDMETVRDLGDSLSAITDNVRGIQDSGGRKTATEVRTAGEAAASRLASHAKLISSQGMVDLTEQTSYNIQQYQSEDFYLEITGQDGQQAESSISPEMLNGDFYYPINDGTLPIDRVAMLDIWKEILIGIAQDPELRANYSFSKIFEYVAELGGAKNIEDFKVQINPKSPQEIEQGLAAGTMQPVQGGGV